VKVEDSSTGVFFVSRPYREVVLNVLPEDEAAIGVVQFRSAARWGTTRGKSQIRSTTNTFGGSRIDEPRGLLDA